MFRGTDGRLVPGRERTTGVVVGGSVPVTRVNQGRLGKRSLLVSLDEFRV